MLGGLMLPQTFASAPSQAPAGAAARKRRPGQLRLQPVKPQSIYSPEQTRRSHGGVTSAHRGKNTLFQPLTHPLHGRCQARGWLDPVCQQPGEPRGTEQRGLLRVAVTHASSPGFVLIQSFIHPLPCSSEASRSSHELLLFPPARGAGAPHHKPRMLVPFCSSWGELGALRALHHHRGAHLHPSVPHGALAAPAVPCTWPGGRRGDTRHLPLPPATSTRVNLCHQELPPTTDTPRLSPPWHPGTRSAAGEPHGGPGPPSIHPTQVHRSTLSGQGRYFVSSKTAGPSSTAVISAGNTAQLPQVLSLGVRVMEQARLPLGHETGPGASSGDILPPPPRGTRAVGHNRGDLDPALHLCAPCCREGQAQSRVRHQPGVAQEAKDESCSGDALGTRVALGTWAGGRGHRRIQRPQGPVAGEDPAWQRRRGRSCPAWRSFSSFFESRRDLLCWIGGRQQRRGSGAVVMDDVTPFPNACAVGGGAPSTVTSAVERARAHPAQHQGAGCPREHGPGPEILQHPAPGAGTRDNATSTRHNTLLPQLPLAIPVPGGGPGQGQGWGPLPSYCSDPSTTHTLLISSILAPTEQPHGIAPVLFWSRTPDQGC
ncbi:hypothetical protein Anapl_11377 [Anas platyrhynchos]|uniref:Uncharacterized protein n=1 Tax=Anas platyrhynchos TaxID=8839 RepID=R0KUK2_ANAPL|nr:hypothetical protein Anapl_11377 [Anas platyrhynchos]